MKRIWPLCLALCLLWALPACGAKAPGVAPSAPAAASRPAAPPAAQPSPAADGTEEALSMEAVVGGKTFRISLYDGAAARALAGRLPLALTMRELNGNEKYGHLDESLPTDEQAPGEIAAGDVMLYGADCLVLFYEGFPTTYRYTPLGRAEDAAGLAAALGAGDVEVRFQREGADGAGD